MDIIEDKQDIEFYFSIDRGGTFTDIYCDILHAKQMRLESRILKLLSVDKKNYEDAPTEGIRRIVSEVIGIEIPRQNKIPTSQIKSIRMGTTVATNALLERKGERTALIINKGLSDKPDDIYEEVVEVAERIRPFKDFDNDNHIQRIVTGLNNEKFVIVEELDLQQVKESLKYLKDERKFNSVAVVLMHSYGFPNHEIEIGKIAKEVGFNQISLSHQVMSRVKIVKRGSTCCVDAYLNPHSNQDYVKFIVQRYLSEFKLGFDEDLLLNSKVFFMQSDGGLAPIDHFSGSKAILSGPAGGVIGFSQTSNDFQMKELGLKNEEIMPAIGFDMGGTSTDVSRFHEQYEHIFETTIAGVSIQAPQMNINTVAAGGGSRLFFTNGLYRVGPESAGADPGPVCYRKAGGQLTVTDANLILGRLLPQYFPKIFGPQENQELDIEQSKKAFEQIGEDINSFQQKNDLKQLSIQQIAMGFIKVANESMCRPIRQMTQARGYNPRDHILNIFGGAGGQHACSLAKDLGIQVNLIKLTFQKIFIHKYCGILSAYGLGLSDVVQENEEPFMSIYDSSNLPNKYLNLRYEGTDTSIMVESSFDTNYDSKFQQMHQREFGFMLQKRRILIDNIRVRSLAKSQILSQKQIERTNGALPEPETITTTFFDQNGQVCQLDTPVYSLEKLKAKDILQGPAIILNQTSTILIEPDCTGQIDDFGNVFIDVGEAQQRDQFKKYKSIEEVPFDIVELSIFGHRFMSIAEQMGLTLQKTSVSTNIKERLDFSCALFDPSGNLVANAPHLPVHLGSMQEAVRYQVNLWGENWLEGEVIVTNHPKAGGTHLPDITVITPVFSNGKPVFYGIQPGSMPSFSKDLSEEGAAIETFKLVQDGVFQEVGITDLLVNQSGDNPLIRGTRNLADNISDLKAQIAANNRGIMLVQSLINEYSLIYVQAYMINIQQNAESSVRQMLTQLSIQQGLKEIDTVHAIDYMDDGSMIKLSLTIDRTKGEAVFDFNFSNHLLSKMPCQFRNSTESRMSKSNQAAVVGGNVETSSRITDVILKAFQACAASQGTMNNLTFGDKSFGYYETIAGGSGAGPYWHGKNGVHTHMTNTRITDCEIFEIRYPVLLREFHFRVGSGGLGKFNGGQGIIREIQFLKDDIEVGILSERRTSAPYGLKGGEDGHRGKNIIIHPDGKLQNFGPKNSTILKKDARIRIMTPGGGGYGAQ
ncbi:5-oxoprolinase [Stylonychia lemnae]|uniref:5-oxoprolinase n=1 Tax=Stylonychia lemnae TaxID=5949 RepID=A0A078A6M3_STYLE|nr:5-oxoprolinase [Stylonychia lemnae]|eukprot:CDW77531.1 5-oxoprolinase [Stylonychia lemnae]